MTRHTGGKGERKAFEKMQTVGSRAEVMHGKAKRTAGGLTVNDMFYDKNGRIRSRRASRAARSANNLGKHQPPKGSGKFGAR